MKFQPHRFTIMLTLALLFSIFWSISPLFAAEKSPILASSNPVIASVDSLELTITDIEDKQINDLRVKLFVLLTKKLQEKALEQLAGKYPEYGQKPNLKIAETEIQEFYQKRRLEGRGPLEKLAPQIRQYLKDQAKTIHNARLYQQALQRGLIVSFLQKPNDFLVRVQVETAYLRGNKKAGVMLLEFSDYQCPFCSRVQPTLVRLREKYSPRVAFGYRHIPLAFHTEADEAAIAVECARDQGKFEPYHDMLFKNYRDITLDKLKPFARQVGISNLARFDKCLDNETYRKRVENDQKAAAEVGIKGTPGFVIGTYNLKKGTVAGELISGAQPYDIFVEAIEKYLKKSR